MVRTSRCDRSYTVMVCRYIMLCAKTSPVPDATTDFGEMSPVMVRSSFRRRASLGTCLVTGRSGTAAGEVDGLAANLVDRSAEAVSKVVGAGADGLADWPPWSPQATRTRGRAARTSSRRRLTGKTMTHMSRIRRSVMVRLLSKPLCGGVCTLRPVAGESPAEMG